MWGKERRWVFSTYFLRQHYLYQVPGYNLSSVKMEHPYKYVNVNVRIKLSKSKFCLLLFLTESFLVWKNGALIDLILQSISNPLMKPQ